MTISDQLSIVSALLALGSLLVAHKSVQIALQLNRETVDARDAATVAACNQRYLDWRSEGTDFENEVWCYGIWDLIATEFNFFRQGWLPLFIFRFWMNTLGTWYTEQPNAWPSHQNFLATYSGSLTEMEDFFQGIWKVARDSHGNTVGRNRRIEEFVNDWHASNVIIPRFSELSDLRHRR